MDRLDHCSALSLFSPSCHCVSLFPVMFSSTFSKYRRSDRIYTVTEKKQKYGMSRLNILNTRRHQHFEEDLLHLTLAPGYFGASVLHSPNPFGSLPVLMSGMAEPRRAVRPELCRAGWGPAGTLVAGNKDRPQGRRRSPSRRRECAWWIKLKQYNQVLTGDTKRHQNCQRIQKYRENLDNWTKFIVYWMSLLRSRNQYHATSAFIWSHRCIFICCFHLLCSSCSNVSFCKFW